MHIPRRRFLGSSFLALGAPLLEAITTPLSKWNRSSPPETEALPNSASPGGVKFVDVAREAGLTTPNVWGGLEH